MVYGGLRPPPGYQRQALVFGLQFQPTEEAAERMIVSPPPGAPQVGGERIQILGVSGTLTGRFARSGVVVDVIAACFPVSDDLRIVPCRRTAGAPADARATVLAGAEAIIDSLDEAAAAR